MKIKNNKKLIIIPTVALALAFLYAHVNTEMVHDAEIRLAETSSDTNLIGQMLPASCESGFPYSYNNYGSYSGCACSANDPAWKDVTIYRCMTQYCSETESHTTCNPPEFTEWSRNNYCPAGSTLIRGSFREIPGRACTSTAPNVNINFN